MLSALFLVVVANIAPWAAGRLLAGRYAWPLDCGATLSDGTRALGDHRTWRGLLAGALGCGLTARLLGESFLLGLEFGALSLAADAASSFVKRRRRLAPGTEVLGLDQLPEALLPLMVLSTPLGIGLLGSVFVAIVFLSLNLAVMRLRHPRAVP
jgi:CDP-archaeol synthase